MLVQRRLLPLIGLFVALSPCPAQDSERPSVYSRRSGISVSRLDNNLDEPSLATDASNASNASNASIATDATDATGATGGTGGNFPSFELESAASDQDAAAKPARNQFAIPAITVTSSLAVVLGLFAAMVWLTRKYGSRSIAPGAIPREVMQSLGTTAIDARTRVTMLRCGNRIIVLAQTASEVRALSEITDPEEVRHLTAACLGDSKRSFASELKSIEQEKPAPGFAGAAPQDFETPRPRGRLFASA